MGKVKNKTELKKANISIGIGGFFLMLSIVLIVTNDLFSSISISAFILGVVLLLIGIQLKYGRERLGCLLYLGYAALALAILVLFLPLLLVNKTQTKEEETEIALTTIETVLVQHNWENGYYPTTEQGLDALIKKPTLPNVSAERILRVDPDWEYAKFIDAWGNPFVYRCPSKREGYDYDLFSCGPDGQEGGNDDIMSSVSR